MKKLQENKAITLIALVITIIVLLILAGITIALIAGQDSAPEKAVQARDANEEGTAKDAATLLIAQKVQGYYEDKYEKSPAETEATNQLEYIAEKLKDGETTGDYKVTVETDGTITVTKGTGEDEETLATGIVSEEGVITWGVEQASGNGPTVVGGIESIQRGDKVDYDPGELTTETASIELPEGAEIKKTKLASINLPSGASVDTTIDASKATEWLVLDTTEDGDVLIIPKTYDTNSLTLEGDNGYNNGIEALNAVAQIYLNPDFAKSARSITVDDINKLENYTSDKESASAYWDSEYGMNDDFDIVYNGGNTISATTGSDEDTVSYTAKVFHTTPEQEDYSYELNNTKSYLGDKSFWLASRFTSVGPYDRNNCSFGGCAYFGLRYVEDNYIGQSGEYGGCECLFYSYSSSDDQYYSTSSHSSSVLPVVYLKSGVKMKKDNNNVWKLTKMN